MWCDLRFVPNSRGNKAAANLGPVRGDCIDKWKIAITPDPHCRAPEFHVCILGYVGTFIRELAAISYFLHSQTSSYSTILAAISGPDTIKQFGYAHFREDAIGGGVSCNEEQLTIIKGLKNEIEGIRGPPGTGGCSILFVSMQPHLHVAL